MIVQISQLLMSKTSILWDYRRGKVGLRTPILDDAVNFLGQCIEKNCARPPIMLVTLDLALNNYSCRGKNIL